ncbi:pyridoxamine 5'-phosphate oxidase family protein [Nocardia miyunensis]|uniref:pyridoxamine 5'-phosphate oxidase family protein n=1 Tax=Nocardia miyunensis TaxID=282684 RepID=UPI00082F6547|nr:pyridoxamine 5'-phosphate oxidase family protein [Nocardia miyunensis]
MGADRRAEIKMTSAEQQEFLRPMGKMALSTIGPDGYIHTTALYYALLGDQVAFLAKRKSQKVVNVLRDSRVTCMREAGEKYYDLRGLTLIGNGEVREDRETLWAVGEYLYRTRHHNAADSRADVERIVERSIHNRAVIVVHPQRVISWDHRKLRTSKQE